VNISNPSEMVDSIIFIKLGESKMTEQKSKIVYFEDIIATNVDWAYCNSEIPEKYFNEDKYKINIETIRQCGTILNSDNLEVPDYEFKITVKEILDDQ
tara:strand:+ start:536 stop:829 length:294 start_codon:yes stop_codon:yes gene_type:complete